MILRLRAFALAVLTLICLACGGGGSTATPTVVVKASVVARGLDQPMLYLPNPADATEAYVLERPGKVRLLVNDVLQAPLVLDITGTVVTPGECGLLGMAFDPNFSSNRYVYLHYDIGNPIETHIVRYSLNSAGTQLSNPYPIFSFQQPTTTNHKGGAINFGADGFLYIMTGDGGGGNDPNNYAQTPNSYLGKILRIDPSVDAFPSDPNQNYSIPVDNPFLGTVGVNPEIWDFGMRNPFRWTVDPVTGGLLIADVGQDAYEEVNYEPLRQGHRNYGWNMREGLHGTANSGPAYFLPLIDPFFEYNHGYGECIIGGFIYRGSVLNASLKGRYFFADFVVGKVVSIPFSLNGAEAVSTSIGSAIDHTMTINAALGADSLSGPSSVLPDKNGEIMITDVNKGTLVRLTP